MHYTFTYSERVGLSKDDYESAVNLLRDTRIWEPCL
jgi:hypothetical protein